MGRGPERESMMANTTDRNGRSDQASQRTQGDESPEDQKPLSRDIRLICCVTEFPHDARGRSTKSANPNKSGIIYATTGNCGGNQTIGRSVTAAKSAGAQPHMAPQSEIARTGPDAGPGNPASSESCRRRRRIRATAGGTPPLRLHASDRRRTKPRSGSLDGPQPLRHRIWPCATAPAYTPFGGTTAPLIDTSHANRHTCTTASKGRSTSHDRLLDVSTTEARPPRLIEPAEPATRMRSWPKVATPTWPTCATAVPEPGGQERRSLDLGTNPTARRTLRVLSAPPCMPEHDFSFITARNPLHLEPSTALLNPMPFDSTPGHRPNLPSIHCA